MASLNRVFILGNLGQDPELRYSANQTPFCSFSVATTDNWTGKDGQRQESTEWHRVVVWNKQAEACGKYLAKGRGVFVDGRLQTRSWDDKNGQKRYTTEIVATIVQFLPQSGAPAGQQYSGASAHGGGASENMSQDRFGDSGPQGGGFAPSFPPADRATGNKGGMGQGADLDDIPF